MNYALGILNIHEYKNTYQYACAYVSEIQCCYNFATYSTRSNPMSLTMHPLEMMLQYELR